MGNLCGKSEPRESGFFLTGPENFKYDVCKPIFEKSNGLLFRLVNDSSSQWAYYNDTKKYEFHVTVSFGPESSNLEALGKTSLAALPEGGWVATNVIYPGKTEPFVQGNIVGFDARVNALLLTTEYQERRKEEKKAEREAKKAALRGESADNADDELGTASERN